MTGVVDRVSWPQALAWRMGRHHLLRRADAAALVPVTARLCGLHAQLMSSAELALWARLDGLTRDAVQEELWVRRSLVKLWAMRGTLHLLPAAELGLWLAGLGSYRDYRSTDPTIVALTNAVGQVLDGAQLTRAELASAVQLRTGSAELAGLLRGSWGVHLKPSSFQGKLCFAPGAGQQVRFTAPASWVPGGIDRVGQQPALAEITRRYLAAFGPAAPADLARWWGVSETRAVRLVDALGSAVVTVDVAGERRWLLAEHAAELAGTAPVRVARLLPSFDPWVAGASRTVPALLDPRHRDRVYRSQGWMSAVLLVAGRMSGVWTSRRVGRRVRVEISPFGRLPGWAHAQAEAEAARLAEFLAGDLELSWRW